MWSRRSGARTAIRRCESPRPRGLSPGLFRGRRQSLLVSAHVSHVTHRSARARALVSPRARAHAFPQAPPGLPPLPGSMLVSVHTPHRSARARALITAPRLRPSLRHSRTAPRSYPRSSQVSFRTHVPPMSHALRFWPAPALSFCPAPAPLVEQRRRPRAARPPRPLHGVRQRTAAIAAVRAAAAASTLRSRSTSSCRYGGCGCDG